MPTKKEGMQPFTAASVGMFGGDASDYDLVEEEEGEEEGGEEEEEEEEVLVKKKKKMVKVKSALKKGKRK